MKTGFFNILLRLLCCAMVLAPNLSFAGNGILGAGSRASVTPTAINVGRSQLPKVNYDEVPQRRQGGILYGAMEPVTTPNSHGGQDMTITQYQPQAIIDWDKFNIGAWSSVYFSQKLNGVAQKDWVALNRIWDANPSQIFGQLQADGKIYLINQNGILFWPGSKVNVNSLIASAMNVTNKDFLNNILHFYRETGQTKTDYGVNANSELEVVSDYYNKQAQEITFGTMRNGTAGYCQAGSCYYDDGHGGINKVFYDPALDKPYAVVSNQGKIQAYTGSEGPGAGQPVNGGYAFFVAPNVENKGTINAPLGQIGIAACTEMHLVLPSSSDTRTAYYAFIKDDYSSDPGYGRAVNQSNAILQADGGFVGMYGYNLENWGIIRSMTAYKNNKGQIELRAANNVLTGPSSVIYVPVNISTETVDDSFNIQPIVDINGLHATTVDLSAKTQLADSDSSHVSDSSLTSIDHFGAITAPTGQVTLKAAGSIEMYAGSSIDVSGVKGIVLDPAVISGKLTSNDLADYYTQKHGILLGSDITTTLIAGTSIGNISSWILGQQRTAAERSIGGQWTKDKSGNYKQQTGSLSITASSGNINVDSGANIDLSGGYVDYKSGYVSTTKLISGNKIYDISNAPLYLTYDAVIGPYTITYERFGITETFANSGIQQKTYVQGYRKGGDAGALTLNAKTISFEGLLNGTVSTGTYQNSWTKQGAYADTTDYSLAKALSTARGLEAPVAGKLTIGIDPNARSSYSDIASLTDSIYIAPDKNTGVSSGSSQYTSVISAKTLNGDDPGKANLSTITLNAVNDITTGSGVVVNLQQGGSFTATAGRIVHQGRINAPAGSINLNIEETKGISLSANQKRIVLTGNSILDVSGTKIDNTISDGISTGLTEGGGIILTDNTDFGAGVFIQPGAVVDVSGGYVVDAKGKITGGNAGTLAIQGSNMELDGSLRGYALADTSGKVLGGSVTLTSTEINVSKSGDHWSGFDALNGDVSSQSGVTENVLNLAGNYFDNTGFSQITLNSTNNVTIDADISTSRVRLNAPSSSAISKRGQSAFGSAVTVAGSTDLDLIRLSDTYEYMAGPSSFSAAAGYDTSWRKSSLQATRLEIGEFATVRTSRSPGTSVKRVRVCDAADPIAVSTRISLTGSIIDIEGDLRSNGGNISATASGGDLTVGGTIDASGYNRPDFSSTIKGFPVNFTPVNGGSVYLTTQLPGASLTLAPGSVINVSGSSDTFTNNLSGPNRTVYSYADAANPGSLSLTFSGTLTWAGTVLARPTSKMPDRQGGTLTIKNANTSNELVIGTGQSAGDFKTYTDSGFDDITLISGGTLRFAGPTNARVGRKLTIDAPVFASDGSNDVNLSAPWIVLTNSSGIIADALSSPQAGAPNFNLTGQANQWIDVIGTMQFSGYGRVLLQAAQDIRFSQAGYQATDQAISAQTGKLSTGGNLVLDANRIYAGNYYVINTNTGKAVLYPDMYSDYDVYAGGTVIVQNTHKGPVSTPYSAGSNLLIQGDQGIDVKDGAYIAAPFGTIILKAPGKTIYVENGSTLTTAGDDAFSVLYNSISDKNKWITDDKVTPNSSEKSSTTAFDDLPSKSVTLDSGTVGTTIVANDAQINVSGGGSLFSYKFQAGTAGSTDPLAKSGRYVVLKASDFSAPGQTIWLNGGGGLSAGWYTMFDLSNSANSRYAFLPGAHILQLQTGKTIPAANSRTNEGYGLTIGYIGTAGTSLKSTTPQVYSVRPAEDVRAEGEYVSQYRVAGNGGDITIKGGTVIIDGKLASNARSGYTGGKLTLSASDIIVQHADSNTGMSVLNPSYSFGDTPMDDKGNVLTGLNVTDDSLSGKGFAEVDLGDASTTRKITVNSGAVLDVAALNLTTSQTDTASIDINSGSQLGVFHPDTGKSGTSDISFTTGKLTISDGASIYASNNITLDLNDFSSVNVKTITVDNTITLRSKALYLGGAEKPKDNSGTYLPGVFLTKTVLDQFSVYNNLVLQSKGYTDASNVYHSDITFQDNFKLSAPKSITLDAGRIVNTGASTAVNVNAEAVNIRNSGSASVDSATSNTGAFAVGSPSDNMVTQINIGPGDVLVSGFNSYKDGSGNEVGGITFNSRGDVTFSGKGSLSTGNSDLTINAARVTTTSTTSTSNITNSDGSTSTTHPIAAANFKIYTGGNYNSDYKKNSDETGLIPRGSIIFTNSGGTQGKTNTAGGNLEFWGASIQNGTVKADGTLIQVDGGNIKFAAKGGDINFRNGAAVQAIGTASAPGGQVTLQTDSGAITLASGSSIDVHGGVQGDAGKITLSAPTGGVTIDSKAALIGYAGTKVDSSKGKGGSFVLYTEQITDFKALVSQLTDFKGSIDLRAKTGNIDANSNITANHIKLTADDAAAGSGQINVSGTLNADTTDGSGLVGLYAMNDINLNNSNGGTGKITARGDGTQGGEVILSSEQGTVNIYQGGDTNKKESSIDVSGNGGTGGTVYLRAQRYYNGTGSGSDNDVRINGNSAINGASAVYVEAFKKYDYNLATLSVNNNYVSWISDSTNFYTAHTTKDTSGKSKFDALNNALGGTVYLLPGVEVANTGDINADVASGWNFSDTRFGGQPGVLTLRAGGNLSITQDIVDHPTTPISSLMKSTAKPSWGFNLVAGADTSSADFMAIKTGQKDTNGNLTGNLTISDQKLVYTENATVRFASGGDTIIGRVQDTGSTPNYMINNTMGYNLATYNGNIWGNVGRDLVINGGAIQTATGDIDISAGRDMQLNATSINNTSVLGAIRTTGEAPSASSMTQYWTYANGGDITLNVGRSVGTSDGKGNLYYSSVPYSWDQFYVIDISASLNNSFNSNTMSTFTKFSSGKLAFIYNGTQYYAQIAGTTTADGSGFTVAKIASLLTDAFNKALTDAGIDGVQVIVRPAAGNRKYAAIFSSATSTDQMSISPSNSDSWLVSALKIGTTNDNLAWVDASALYGHWAAGYTRGSGMSILGTSDTKTYDVTSGLATMGGGKLSISAGGDFLAQAGTFGQNSAGDRLEINAQGDMKGRFIAASGTADISAMGNFGDYYNQVQIELFNSRMAVTSAGEMQIGAILNPSLASDQGNSRLNKYLVCGYDPSTKINLKAGTDITIWGKSPVYDTKNSTYTNYYAKILPANVDVEAMTGNINLQGDHFVLASSPTGNLSLIADKGNIQEFGSESMAQNAAPGIVMSDLYTDEWYGKPFLLGMVNQIWYSNRALYNNHGYLSGDSGKTTGLLHTDENADSQSVIVSAGGDIVNLGLYLPKKASIYAGGDIINMMYEGQNIKTGDVSTVMAQGNILMSYAQQTTDPVTGQPEGSKTGFVQGGPGVFVVQAGGSIDLGTSNNYTSNGKTLFYGGVQAIGNGNNAYLDSADKSTLIVLAGYGRRMPVDESALFPITAADYISNFNIAAGANVIGFTYNGKDYKAAIDAHAYANANDLANAIQNALNGAKASDGTPIGSNTFTVTYSSGKLAVTNNSNAGDITNFLATKDTTLSGSQLGFTGNSYTLVKKSSAVTAFFDELRTAGDLYGMLMAGGDSNTASQIIAKVTALSAAFSSNTVGNGAFWNALSDTAKSLATAVQAGGLESKLASGGYKEDAAVLLADTRSRLIDTFLGKQSGNGAGNIDMLASQIGASVGKSDIYVIANGKIDLGTTSTSSLSAATTGIWTGGGGGVNVFARGDINVNESRIMTYYGGDITVWSDAGNINAGRGSRTAVSASPPRKALNTVTNTYTLVFTPPASGSGIRAVTYGENAPEPGNIHLFAPNGIIDAGEAGITGNKIILAATQVVNASNISFSAGSVGVPQSASTGNIGALTGSGSLPTSSQLAGDTTAMSGTKAQASQMMDDIMAKWVDVKVIDFVEDTQGSM